MGDVVGDTCRQKEERYGALTRDRGSCAGLELVIYVGRRLQDFEQLGDFGTTYLKWYGPPGLLRSSRNGEGKNLEKQRLLILRQGASGTGPQLDKQ